MKTLKQYITESSLEVNGFVILKPEFTDKADEWCNMLQNNGWQIVQKKNFKMSVELAKELYNMHKDEKFYNDLCNYMASGDCLCAMCHKDCEDPIGDMKALKDKVRKAWGKDDMKNAMHSSDSLDNVKREYKLIFS
jgi:nucleoside-diphosphate kinase